MFIQNYEIKETWAPRTGAPENNIFLSITFKDGDTFTTVTISNPKFLVSKGGILSVSTNLAARLLNDLWLSATEIFSPYGPSPQKEGPDFL